MEKAVPDTTLKSKDKPGEAATPMMAQYLEIKSANPDCLLFYRMGDFYELFFEDAVRASQSLGIMLTKRGKHRGEDIPMCGVPVERANDYLQKLIALGHRVAVCEQLEDPAEAKKRGSKSVVRRDVVRLVTPGTVTEEVLLDPARPNAFAALARARGADGEMRYGLACVDISTGAFTALECAEKDVPSELARLEPREIVLPESLFADDHLRALLQACGAPVTPLGREAGESAAERRLTDFYGVATLDGLGLGSKAEILACACAIFYVERTQKAERPALARPMSQRHAGALEMDAATRANLEISRTLGGEREGSLLSVVDLTATPAGARLLAERIGAPSTDREEIARRHDAAAFFLKHPRLREGLRNRLKRAPDLARALSRLSLQRGGPRDLAAVGLSLLAAREIAHFLSDAEAPAEIAAGLAELSAADVSLQLKIAGSLVEEPPLDRRGGGFVRAGVDAELDEARELRDQSRQVVAGLQARYAEETLIRQLKIKHNNFLGFFIEVPQAQGERLLRAPFENSFTHRQTMADAMRFSTRELVELDARIASAGDRALARELFLFDALAAEILAQSPALQRLGDGFARLDVFSALGELAAQRDWRRPVIDESLDFEIVGGRHPVVEASLKAQGKIFAPNGCELSGGAVAVVTGPNMAGKSTFLRQNALIVLLAQAGSFVPAEKARIGIVDRLFSRVGASDDLARGRSTFMVEMVETAAILNGAGPRALVILDEIGRGTATFDGLSIAWATIEHLHEVNRCRAIFATHFHELTQLTKKLPRLVNLTMRVADHAGEIVFLHEVIKGAADRSYGVHVAELAGLPPSVVARAHHILGELEAADRRAPVEKLIDDLPLFSHAATAQAKAGDPLREALKAIDPDVLSPREALAALYELKMKAGKS
ncbi:DNA mismatch repair protein MutS [Methylocystis heyeri]|uniref:DNA mismatch repair protein MutS n=1 Tax=Methylocystis heyeri TaxID=391905 RepID=A0A6B8KG99_9HYPH|nr:DNA mismatch repair protein MutS [Methylocystis heyeri]QGM47404.1 DNA mismatch repair protein MutS [Methylocystis heyeri]